MAKMGRPTIFQPKDPAHRYQGVMTKGGARAFEQARKRLVYLAKKHAGMSMTRASDADVFEYLARGEDATIEYLRKLDGKF